MTLPNHNTALRQLIIGIYTKGASQAFGKANGKEGAEYMRESEAAINKLMYEETLELLPGEKHHNETERHIAYREGFNDAIYLMRQAAAERFNHGK